MPVRNAEPYLDASLGSILDQTFGDFEVICLDDSSTDRSLEVLHTWARKDSRIQVHVGPRPLGPTAVSNRVMSLARAPLIARMDADDVSLPFRFERQMEVFREHGNVALVAGLFEGINETGDRVRPADRWRLLRKVPLAPFAHGSMMVSRSHFNAAGGYRRPCEFWEDLDLYYRLAGCGRIMVLPYSLYLYRFRLHSSRMSETPEMERTIELMWQCVAEARRGRNYDALLDQASASPAALSATIHLVTLVSLAAPRLWAGEATDVLAHPRLKRDATLLSPRALKYVVYALWAHHRPDSLRACLRALIHARDWVAGLRLRNGSPVEWRPGGRQPATAVPPREPAMSGALRDKALG